MREFLEDILFAIIFLAIGKVNEMAILSLFRETNMFSLIALIYLSFFLPVIFVLARNFELTKGNYFEQAGKCLKQVLPIWKPFFALFLAIKMLSMFENQLGLINIDTIVSSVIGLNYGSIIVLFLLSSKREIDEKRIERIVDFKKLRDTSES